MCGVDIDHHQPAALGMILVVLLTMATPRSSALLNLTMSVERMTEVRGAMADTQKSFGLFFACK
jgi:hypothetical protein